MSVWTSALANALLHSLWQLTVIAACVALTSRGWRPRVQYALHVAGFVVGLVWFAVTAIVYALTIEPAPPWVWGEPAMSWAGLVVLVWSTGVAAFTLRLMASLWILARIRAAALEASPRWLARMQSVARRLGVRHRVALLSSTRVDQPITMGWLRPAIVVPASLWSRLPTSYLEALLAHELAHIRRYDFVVNVFQSLVESLFFFHPLVWWMSRRTRELREYCCDDIAVAALDSPHQYARALTELESLRPQLQHAAPAALGRGGQLMKRFRRLIHPSQTSARAPRVLAALLSAGLLAVFAVSSVRARVDAEAEPPAWLPPSVEAWWPDIVDASARHGLDPQLLAIITLIESGGDEHALSPTGATGLMQVMPTTGAAIARERGIREYDLNDPATSLDFGAWYLAQQLEAFGGVDRDEDVLRAAAAYNGGPKVLRRHLDGRGTLSAETENYVKLVSELWAERDAEASSTLKGWRGRVQARWHRGAVHPLVDASYKETAPFGRWARHPISGKPAEHNGVDWAASAGTPVHVPERGWVIAAEKRDAAGNTVIVRHPSGVETRYHHLESYSVAAGDRVDAGDEIGRVGSSGQSTGPHLHFEVRDLGIAVNPDDFVP